MLVMIIICIELYACFILTFDKISLSDFFTDIGDDLQSIVLLDIGLVLSSATGLKEHPSGSNFLNSSSDIDFSVDEDMCELE